MAILSLSCRRRDRLKGRSAALTSPGCRLRPMIRRTAGLGWLALGIALAAGLGHGPGSGGGLGSLPAPARAADSEPVLHVYNWSNYIADDTLKKFTAETGITVHYDVFDSNEVLEAKLLAGSSGYDVVVPTGTFLARMIRAGLVAPLDKSRLPNLTYMDRTLEEQISRHDPDNRYGVIYMWGTTGLGLNVGKVRAALGPDVPLDSYDLLFKPEYASKLAACGISVLDSPSQAFPIARAYLGLPADSQDPVHLDKATNLWLGIRPFLRKFDSSEYITALANGDICLALGFSGDVFQASERAQEAGRKDEIRFVIPREGTLVGFDVMAIPADAPHPENAHAFINFIQRPEIMAEITNAVWYANANRGALALVDPAVRDNPGIYPPEPVLHKLFVQTGLSPKLEREQTRAWTRVKSGL